ncbi:hypothetical protein VULLAG_LOCUS19168 [Vulpes lagopus]
MVPRKRIFSNRTQPKQAKTASHFLFRNSAPIKNKKLNQDFHILRD